MAYLDNTGVTRLATDLKAKLAEKEHEHSAADVTSGTLAVARGGTGVTTNPSMLTNLGSTTADDVLKASPRPGVTGTLAIANGGTGATTAAGAAENIVDGQAIEPASVAATGEVSAKSGTTTHKLTEKAEDSRADNLEASIAYVESTTAKTNHASGDYFMLGDVLMKATAAIATGEQITTSNATPATVQSQIDALRDSVSRFGSLSIYESSSNVKTYTFRPSNTSGEGRNRLGMLLTWYGAWFIRIDNDINVYPMSSITDGVTLSASYASGTITLTLSTESWGGVRLIWLD